MLGRDDLGAIEPGRCADLAVWRTDRFTFSGADDPVAMLVLGGPYPVERLYVGGELVVHEQRLARVNEEEIARMHQQQARRFAGLPR